MPGDREPPIEPEDDLSEAARRLGDRFLPDQPAADDDDGPSADDSAPLSYRDAYVRGYERLMADVYRNPGQGDLWPFTGRIEARARVPEGRDTPPTDWQRVIPEIIAQLREGQPGVSDPWERLAGVTDLDIRMIVRDTPSVRLDSDDVASWEEMAEHTDLDFRLFVPQDGPPGGSEADRPLTVEPLDSSTSEGWIQFETPSDPESASPTLGVTVRWQLEPKDDGPIDPTEPPRESVLDYIDQPEERPPSSPLEAMERELGADAQPLAAASGTPQPPGESVLDYIDQPEERPPSSPLEAIERELSAEQRTQTPRLPRWVWPVGAAGLLAIFAFLALNGGGDDDAAGADPTATVSGVEATASPASGASPAAGTGTDQPTAPTAAIPSVIICPDGTTFSGYEQDDGSYIDAETGEPRVCPPPPN